jgi:hypothetical protein
MNPTAQIIINICEAQWDAEKSDCSGFVRAVAGPLGVSLTGLADDIYGEIQGDGWTSLSDGSAAKDAADQGLFVIAALKGAMNVPPQDHGHVAVVVSGPLDASHNAYPTGYWGSLGGVGKKNTTLNFAWNAASRDKVEYASTIPTAVQRTSIDVQVNGVDIPTAAGYMLDNETFAWIRPIADALGAQIADFTGQSVNLILGADEHQLTVTVNDGQSFIHLGDLSVFPELAVSYVQGVVTITAQPQAGQS